MYLVPTPLLFRWCTVRKIHTAHSPFPNTDCLPPALLVAIDDLVLSENELDLKDTIYESQLVETSDESEDGSNAPNQPDQLPPTLLSILYKTRRILVTQKKDH